VEVQVRVSPPKKRGARHQLAEDAPNDWVEVRR